MIITRYLIFVFFLVLLFGCSLSGRVHRSITEMQKYEGGGSWGGKYVHKNRKRVFDLLPNEYMDELDTLLIIERFTGIDVNYSATISGNPIKVFYAKDYLARPIEIDYNLDTLNKPVFEEYVFELVRRGELNYVLERSKNVPVNTGMSSMFFSVIFIDGKDLIASGFKLNSFRNKEEERVMDSLRRELNLRRRSSDWR
jgi:hypothetical protein